MRLFISNLSQAELEWSYGYALDRDWLAELRLRRALTLSPMGLRNRMQDEPWEAEIALRVEYSRRLLRHRQKSAHWYDSILRHGDWRSLNATHYSDSGFRVEPLDYQRSGYKRSQAYWERSLGGRRWTAGRPRHRVPLSRRRLHDRDAENFVRRELGSLKTRLLDEEYYPEPHGFFEGAAIRFARLRVW